MPALGRRLARGGLGLSSRLVLGPVRFGGVLYGMLLDSR
jgi:hypothetical protein